MDGAIHHYLAYGLRWASDLACPGFTPAPAGDWDVRIRLGEVPAAPPDAADPGRYRGLLEDGSFLITARELASLHMREGRTMTVQPGPDSDAASVRHLALGWGLGALFPQMGRVALHGAAVADGAGAFLLCGAGGTGKSTTARILVSRGWQQLDDNVMIVHDGPEGPFLAPGSREVKLWSDAVTRLAPDAPREPVWRDHGSKWILMGDLPDDASPRPLRGVICLALNDEDGPPRLERLVGQRAFLALRRQVFCPAFAAKLMDEATRMARLRAICLSVPVFRLVRPRNGDSLDGVVELLENLRDDDGAVANSGPIR